MYELNGNIEKAEIIYRELVAELKLSNDLYNLPIIYSNLASVLLRKNDAISALDFLTKAIEISEQMNDTSFLSSLYGDIGELLLGEGKLDSAKVFLNKSVLCSQSIEDLKTECLALVFLTQIDSLQNDHISQLVKLKRIAQLKEAISDNRTNNNFEAIELQYENKKGQKIIELQKQIIQSDKTKKQLFVTLLIISSILVVLLGVLTFFIRRSHRNNQLLHDHQIKLKQLEVKKAKNDEASHKLQKEKAENELYIKSSELVASAMQVEQKHELLNHINKKLVEIINTDISTPIKEELETLSNSFKLFLNDQDNMDLFNKKFQQVHKDFFKVLKQTHPDLTKTELKFCAYLRVQLSSSQISTVMNVTSEAIRKTRYRLRKKLQLEPSDSLEDYIMKF
jgi:tetratricopeptide (TPR) repeat protein